MKEVLKNYSIELILLRQLSAYLGVAIVYINPDGLVVFYNEPTGLLLKRPIREMEDMIHWSEFFKVSDPIVKSEFPVWRVLSNKKPVVGQHKGLLEDIEKPLYLCAIPMIGLGGRFLGVVAMLWEFK